MLNELRTNGNGTIRIFLGFLMVAFGVGADDTAEYWQILAIVIPGLLIMMDGVVAINRKTEENLREIRRRNRYRH